MSATMWKCEVCGYVHQGPQPPDTCPVCGVGPELFTALQIDDGPSEAPSRTISAWRCTVCDYLHEGPEPPEVCPVCGVGSDLFEPVEAAEATPAEQAGEAQAVVIVGAGIAGLTAAEQARAMAPEAAITIVSKEAGLPYYRLNLSRLLAEEVTEEEMLLKPAEWFEQNRIELCEGEVAQIDRREHQLILREGRTLSYERLILANGAHPFVPPISGVTREGVLAFRTLADVRSINELASGRGCVCIGGGLLGLETAGALARRGISVTVLEGFGWLLPRQLPRQAGELLQAHLEKLGIGVRCDVKIKEIVGDERVAGVKLEDGEVVDGELVIVTTGVRANSHLARQCGLQTGNGVIVDDQMRTSDPAIFAAGDVAEHNGVVYGIWPASFAQGMVAGRNAVGGAARFPEMPPANSLKVLDVDMISVGRIQPDDGSYSLVEEQREQVYRRFVCRDGRLVGAVLYGDTAGATAVREAIEQQSQLLALPALLEQFPALAETVKRSAA